jgi:hypothetical protein
MTTEINYYETLPDGLVIQHTQPTHAQQLEVFPEKDLNQINHISIIPNHLSAFFLIFVQINLFSIWINRIVWLKLS